MFAGHEIVHPPGPVTWMHAENSDVLPKRSVAVAVMNAPTVTATGKLTLNGARQPGSVVARVKPRKLAPSPLPDTSQDGFEKNSILNCALAVLLRLP